MDCSLPGFSVHGILQARILEWVAIPFSRGSSWSRNQTQVPFILGRFFTIWTTREVRSVPWVNQFGNCHLNKVKNICLLFSKSLVWWSTLLVSKEEQDAVFPHIFPSLLFTFPMRFFPGTHSLGKAALQDFLQNQCSGRLGRNLGRSPGLKSFCLGLNSSSSPASWVTLAIILCLTASLAIKMGYMTIHSQGWITWGNSSKCTAQVTGRGSGNGGDGIP